MTTAAELKSSHLEQIKNYLKEYISKGNEVTFRHDEADGFSEYRLTAYGFYTRGYAYFESSDGAALGFTLVDKQYADSDKIYSTVDFYKHLQYDLACQLLNNAKD